MKQNITDEQILLREISHQMKVSSNSIVHKRNPCLSGYEQFNRDFESNGYQITPDHNNLNKRMLAGKGTGVAPTSSGRRARPCGSTITIERTTSHVCTEVERHSDKECDAEPDKAKVLQECK